MSSKSAVAMLLVLMPVVAVAQSDDDQTRDWEEQDRRYFKRYAEPEPADTDPAVLAPADLDAFIARADELIRDRNYRADTSTHYRVQTDDPRLVPSAATELLEAFRGFFDELLDGRIELATHDESSRVFLFYSFYRYNQLLSGDWRRQHLRPAGHYRTELDIITVHTDANSAALADTLVHEAAHQLIEQRIFEGRGETPLWIAEGLATYFGYTLRDRDGRFRPGEVGTKQTALFRDPKLQGGEQAKLALRQARAGIKQARSDDLGPFGRVVFIESPADFYGNAGITYAAAWLVCHYLLHGDDGVHADDFLAYLEGRPGRGDSADLLFEQIDMTPRQLDEAVARHAKRLKVR